LQHLRFLLRQHFGFRLRQHLGFGQQRLRLLLHGSGQQRLRLLFLHGSGQHRLLFFLHGSGQHLRLRFFGQQMVTSFSPGQHFGFFGAGQPHSAIATRPRLANSINNSLSASLLQHIPLLTFTLSFAICDFSAVKTAACSFSIMTV